MKNGRYVINRDDVYVGEVVDTVSISKEKDCETLCILLFLLDQCYLF